MRNRFAALSSIVFSGALVLGAAPAWAQAEKGGTKGDTGSVQKPTDPPMGTQRGKTGESVGQAERSGTKMGRDAAPAGARMGQRSRDDIKQVQEALKSKGHDPGEADGIMGPRTQQALRAFQKEQGMQATGQLDQKTASALGVEGAAKAGAGMGTERRSGVEKSGTPGAAGQTPESRPGKMPGEKSGARSDAESEKAGSTGKSGAGKAGAAGQTPESQPGKMPGDPGSTTK